MPVDENPSNLIAESDLRAALRPHRCDPDDFLAGVESKVQGASEHSTGATLPPFAQSAASFLPLPLLTTGKLTAGTAAKSSVPVLHKIALWLALPATVVFLLLGAAVFGVLGLRNRAAGEPVPEDATRDAVVAWAGRHRLLGWLGLVIVFVLPFFLSAASYFLALLLSVGALVYITRSLAAAGIGNRAVVASWCTVGLMFVAVSRLQMVQFQPGWGIADPRWISIVTLVGACVMLLIARSSGGYVVPRRERLGNSWVGMLLLLTVMALPVSSLVVDWSRGPHTVKAFVESFDEAPFRSASWRWWGYSAQWCQATGAEPDLAIPQQLLERSGGRDDSYIAAIATRAGLQDPTAAKQFLSSTTAQRELAQLLDSNRTTPIRWMEQREYLLRCWHEYGDAAPAQIDQVVARLNATWQAEEALRPLLRCAELLALFGADLNTTQYRAKAHEVLRNCWVPEGRFGNAGGFNNYPDLEHSNLDTTVEAIQLMQRVGIPEAIPTDRVRDYLHGQAALYLPLSVTPETDVSALVALDMLQQLRDFPPTSTIDRLVAARGLLAAVLLVLLCLYAAASSPAFSQPSYAPGRTQ
ncbi:MAG: hypothetical protein AAF581_02950 [Planctomycetota bacterium]